MLRPQARKRRQVILTALRCQSCHRLVSRADVGRGACACGGTRYHHTNPVGMTEKLMCRTSPFKYGFDLGHVHKDMRKNREIHRAQRFEN